jgi:uncharacterized protein YbcC (UPF0753/DUF2309 family)
VETPTSRLSDLIADLAHYLPEQGPLQSFIHHNTLHAFEHLHFEQALKEAAEIYGAEPFLAEEEYRQALKSGRIPAEILEEVLNREGLDSKFYLPLLSPGLQSWTAETIQWDLENRQVLSRFRETLPFPAEAKLRGFSPAALFHFWQHFLEQTPLDFASGRANQKPADREREVEQELEPILIRLLGGYLDLGFAYWPMPEREKGFWRAACSILAAPGMALHARLDPLRARLREWRELGPEQAIEAALEKLGVPEGRKREYLLEQLLRLPGWAGMFRRLGHPLEEYLAVRLLLRSCWNDAWRPESQPIETKAAQDRSTAVSAAILTDASQLHGHTLPELLAWGKNQRESYARRIAAFDDFERRRIWHLAYELAHERAMLKAIRQSATLRPVRRASRANAQVFCCIDDREESFRRHLEEVDEGVETFGTAGFFGIPMSYAGLDDQMAAPQCPPFVTPRHEVREVAGPEASRKLNNRRTRLGAWARSHLFLHTARGTLLRGFATSVALGLFTLVPMLGRLMHPALWARLTEGLRRSLLPGMETATTLATPDMTTADKATYVGNVLRAAGLTDQFAPLVLMLGHGATSLNNPHSSAYECGACGGRHGGPNARLFARLANDKSVRELLAREGIVIPAGTLFLGGRHDTTSDAVDFYDLDAIPGEWQPAVERLRAATATAAARNAQERCRRFLTVPAGLSLQKALQEVQARSEHLAEPRPEFNHCTNALCIVGRRSLTRGLFLDRRAFLVSYDPAKDETGQTLVSILSAVVPVCSGINLEYFFSTMDKEVYGCGTKLPHNLVANLGVMNGVSSDLRTGLSTQMTEIHEPVRLLFVVESPTERIEAAFASNAGLSQLLNNQWIRLAAIDERAPEVILVRQAKGQWVALPSGESEGPLPVYASSREYFGDQRGHLPAARIDREAAIVTKLRGVEC